MFNTGNITCYIRLQNVGEIVKMNYHVNIRLNTSMSESIPKVDPIMCTCACSGCPNVRDNRNDVPDNFFNFPVGQ